MYRSFFFTFSPILEVNIKDRDNAACYSRKTSDFGSVLILHVRAGLAKVVYSQSEHIIRLELEEVESKAKWVIFLRYVPLPLSFPLSPSLSLSFFFFFFFFFAPVVYAVEFSFYWQLISDLLSFKYFTFSYIIYHLLNRESSYILASTCNNSPVYLVLL